MFGAQTAAHSIAARAPSPHAPSSLVHRGQVHCRTFHAVDRAAAARVLPPLALSQARSTTSSLHHKLALLPLHHSLHHCSISARSIIARVNHRSGPPPLARSTVARSTFARVTNVDRSTAARSTKSSLCYKLALPQALSTAASSLAPSSLAQPSLGSTVTRSLHCRSLHCRSHKLPLAPPLHVPATARPSV